MDTDSVQLSHEELLLVVGLLGLPTPLALGPRPADGYERLALGAGLAAAGASLVARDLAHPAAAPDLPPVPVPALATFARAVAHAEGCLILAERHGDERRVAHLNACGAELVLHTSPAPRVHRLVRLRDAEAATAWLVTLLAANHTTVGPRIRLPVTTLVSVVEAVAAGQAAAAQAHLAAAGVLEAAAFVGALGPAPRRLALSALRGLSGSEPLGQGAVALCGTAGIWWGTSDADWVELEPIDAPRLVGEVGALVTWLQG